MRLRDLGSTRSTDDIVFRNLGLPAGLVPRVVDNPNNPATAQRFVNREPIGSVQLLETIDERHDVAEHADAESRDP